MEIRAIEEAGPVRFTRGRTLTRDCDGLLASLAMALHPTHPARLRPHHPLEAARLTFPNARPCHPRPDRHTLAGHAKRVREELLPRTPSGDQDPSMTGEALHTLLTQMRAKTSQRARAS